MTFLTVVLFALAASVATIAVIAALIWIAEQMCEYMPVPLALTIWGVLIITGLFTATYYVSVR